MDKEEHVIRHQTGGRPDLGSEEVGGDEHVQVRANELRPCSRLLPLRSWKNAVALQDIAYGLVTHGVPQVVQGIRDAVVAPGAVLHSPNAKEIFCQVE
jgi:hypothetical protein